MWQGKLTILLSGATGMILFCHGLAGRVRLLTIYEKRSLGARGLAGGVLAMMLGSCGLSSVEATDPAGVSYCPDPGRARVIWRYIGTGYRANDVAASGDTVIIVGQTKLTGLVSLLDVATGDRKSFHRGPRIARAVLAMSDGGHVVAGGNRAQARAERIDRDGRVLWSILSRIDHSVANAVAGDAHGGILLAGQVGEGPYARPWAARVGATGDLVWEKIFPDPGVLLAVTPSPGGHVVAGVSLENGARMSIGFMDQTGDMLWSSVVDNDYSAIAQSIVSSDQGYLVSGFSDRGTEVFGVGSGGSRLWQRSYPDIDGNGAHHGLARFRGGYVVTGSYGGQAVAAGFAEDGCLLWRFEASEARIARSVLVLADGDVVLVGDRADGGGFWSVRLRIEQ